MGPNMADDSDHPDQEIARRRDEAVRRMIATPPKTLKGVQKRKSVKPPRNSAKKPTK